MKDAKELCVEHAIEAGAEEVETENEELEPGYFKVSIFFSLVLYQMNRMNKNS